MPTTQPPAAPVFLPLVERPSAGISAFSVAVVPARPSITRIYLPVAAAETAPSPTPPVALDIARCRVYPNVRITWYELGTCCGKAPGHPQYGITRSGMPAVWGMAAVQAQHPLLPRYTRFIVADIGPSYRFTVTDTGSETAFGRDWIDLYAPTVEVGRWLERKIGPDGRSTVLVCPEPGG